MLTCTTKTFHLHYCHHTYLSLNTNILKIFLHYYQYRKYKNGKQQMHHTIANMDGGKLVFGSCNEQHAEYEYFHFLISKNHLHKEQSILVVLEY